MLGVSCVMIYYPPTHSKQSSITVLLAARGTKRIGCGIEFFGIGGKGESYPLMIVMFDLTILHLQFVYA